MMKLLYLLVFSSFLMSCSTLKNQSSIEKQSSSKVTKEIPFNHSGW